MTAISKSMGESSFVRGLEFEDTSALYVRIVDREDPSLPSGGV